MKKKPCDHSPQNKPRNKNGWTRAPFYWREGTTLFCSIPFTFTIPEVRFALATIPHDWDRVVVGGPAVELLPGSFDDFTYVTEGHDHNTVLQISNPRATRTSIGCNNKCGFCAIGNGILEPGGFRECEDWPDLPILMDNNILQCSHSHWSKVIGRLQKHKEPDIQQGLDIRAFTDLHAEGLKSLRKPNIRFALDSPKLQPLFTRAIERIRKYKISVSRVSSYAILGYNSTPEEDYARCQFIIDSGATLYTTWFHNLDELTLFKITQKQKDKGWTSRKRTLMMRHFYRARPTK